MTFVNRSGTPFTLSSGVNGDIIFGLDGVSLGSTFTIPAGDTFAYTFVSVWGYLYQIK